MSHQAIEIVEVEDAAVGNNTAGSAARSSTRSTLPPRISDEAGPGDANAGSHNSAVSSCLDRIRRRLGETKERFPGEKTLSPTIFKFPRSVAGVNQYAEVPEIVSIGPYYSGWSHLLGFQPLKWFYLQRFFRHSMTEEESIIKFLADTEFFVRSHYSEPVRMTSADFLEMMLLDCCFVLELLQIFKSDDPTDEGGPIFTQPWTIPVLIRDLLKLGNQVPFSILEELNCMRHGITLKEDGLLCRSALRVFDQVYPSSAARSDFTKRPDHLLHLFYSTLVPKNQQKCEDQRKYRPSDQSIPSVTKLWSSGIKFKSIKKENFLGISLRKRVLEIPPITINEFTTTMLINCLALEQCRDNSSRHITEYVHFMHCLINQSKDVSLLCSNGIITRFSHNDQHVVNFFNAVGSNIVFNVRDCNLSRQLEELDTYYNSNWAYIMRTYFSSPWSFIAFFSAFLGLGLTATQTFYAILGHHSR